MYETGITREAILNELSRSAHGKLGEYFPIINPATKVDPEFVAHLIAWDFINGQVKDSKLAIPVLTLQEHEFPDELVENSLAHLMLQPPREILKALKFACELGVMARRQHGLDKAIRSYLQNKESEPGKWSRLAIRHRRSLKSLYALTRCPMPQWGSVALFGWYKDSNGNKVYAPYPAGSVFADIANLHQMEPTAVAATIQKWHLSPLIVSGAMTGAKSKQEDSAVVQATMNQMSDTEVVTRAASLERKGLSRDLSLKETFRKKISKATKSSKATLKTSVAAEQIEDESLKTMLKELQERQIQAQKDVGRGIDGNWLVIADKSQSQEAAIEISKHVAAAIAKFVTGRIWLAFCDTGCAGAEVTGLSLEQIKEGTRFMRASGSTSYGIGLAWAFQDQFNLDGVVIVGDGGENNPPFFHTAHLEWKRYREKDLPVYFYQTYVAPQYAMTSGGNPQLFENFMRQAGIPVNKYDLTHGAVDYYSLPNLVQQMNANKFSVVDKIMACPLLTFEQIGLKLPARKEKANA